MAIAFHLEVSREAIVEAHRAECEVRDRRLKVREEEIRRRNTDLVYLLRTARKYETATRASMAKENRLPNPAEPWEAGYATRPTTAPARSMSARTYAGGFAGMRSCNTDSDSPSAMRRPKFSTVMCCAASRTGAMS